MGATIWKEVLWGEGVVVGLILESAAAAPSLCTPTPPSFSGSPFWTRFDLLEPSVQLPSRPPSPPVPAMVSSSALPSPSTSSMPPKSATLSTRPIHAPQALCLLCSSSLPPNRPPPVETKCCRRSICGTCVCQKARATRWDPCLYCAPGLRSGPSGAQEGAFVLGDDDDDDQEADNKGDPIERDGTAGVEELVDLGQEESCADDPPAGSAVRHIVRKGDTLIGISLKYGLDVGVFLGSLSPLVV